METQVYSQAGKEVSKIKLPESVFGARYNADLIKQVVDSLLSSRRTPVAHTKDRSEVRGGGRKPWKQKGTGRARHGSTRSPIWVGGGVTGGPRNTKNYDRKVSKKMRTSALFSILSRKYEDGEILFIDSLALKEPKTKEAVQALNTLSGIQGFETILSKKKNSAVIALSDKSRDLERSFSNLSNVEVLEARNLNPISLLKYKYLVIENPAQSLEVLPGVSKIKAKPKAEPKVKASVA